VSVWLKLVTLFLLPAALPVAQNSGQLKSVDRDLQKLEQNFQKQKDPVHRAKALAKLLPKEVEAAGLKVKAGQVDEGIEMLTHYRDETRHVYQALVATDRNPVKKPDGFMQLQIALRESVRRLRSVLYIVPYERRQRVEAVRADMEQLNAQLLQQLFPPPHPKPRKDDDTHS